VRIGPWSKSPDGATPLSRGLLSLPGAPESRARDALARLHLKPPDLWRKTPALSKRYALAFVTPDAETGRVNGSLGRAGARLRGSFPADHLLLIEVPEDGPGPAALRDSAGFGLVVPLTEGAPGDVDANTQAAALGVLIRSLEPQPAWAAGPDDDTIERFPPGTPVRALDIRAPRFAGIGKRVAVLYELVIHLETGGVAARTTDTRILLLFREEEGLRVERDLSRRDAPEDLEAAVEPIRLLTGEGSEGD
jgi:hypothetical protein